MDIKDGLIFYIRKSPSDFGKIHSESLKKKKKFTSKAWPRLLRNKRKSSEKISLASLSNTTSFLKNYEKADELASTQATLLNRSFRLYKRPDSQCVDKLKKKARVIKNKLIVNIDVLFRSQKREFGKNAAFNRRIFF